MKERHWDLMNMIIAFDETVKKLIVYLKAGESAEALAKAEEIDSVLCRVKEHCADWTEQELLNKL